MDTSKQANQESSCIDETVQTPENASSARIEAIRDRGVHRASDHEGPFSLHLLGIGKTGAAIIAHLLRNRPPGFLGDARTTCHALAIDVGDDDLQALGTVTGLLADRCQVNTVSLAVPPRDELFRSLRRYREFLKMEYPRYYWNPNYEPWLPSDIDLPKAGEHFPRAVAKALYGTAYYQDGPIARMLDAFARQVDASAGTPIVCIVFSLAGGTGSGIVVDLARHLSNIKLGRRPWVVGIGVLPCDGDPAATQDGTLFPVLSELDCMIDVEKNKGVMAVWGDLYKNPFTGGFFVVPQNDVYRLTGSLAATHQYVNEGIANFLARDNGLHLYEALKLLNWLSVSGERWHPAMRGEANDRWITVLTSRKLGDAASLGALELRQGFQTEYVEARAFAPKSAFGADREASVKSQINSAVSTPLGAGLLHFDAADQPLINVCVPRASKVDLPIFAAARVAYDQLNWDQKLLRHSWLLDLGVLLCEPSIRFEGMAGECIWGCACWVVVPQAAIRGEVTESAVKVKVGV